jgi:streptomycin 6-kinase
MTKPRSVATVICIRDRLSSLRARRPGYWSAVSDRDVPALDDQLRRRLGRRFGSSVEGWLDRLPPVLRDLADRWELTLDSVIQRGTVSVVLRCRTSDGARVVLKVSPDRARITEEARALAGWSTPAVPAVLAVDPGAGAVLLEAIEPGAPLDESAEYPRLSSLGLLVAALHHAGPAPSVRPLTDRITRLFDSGRANYERRPDLRSLVPPEPYERGHRLAMRLAADPGPAVVLHGDLTPANVLDGGPGRGLVAIDPAPCLGDPGFDTVDLLLWRAPDLDTVTTRAERLAPYTGVPAHRALAWCAAFASMTALELAEASPIPPAATDWLLALARTEVP